MSDDKLSPLEALMLHDGSGIRTGEALEQIQARVTDVSRYEIVPGYWVKDFGGEPIWLIPYLAFYFKSGGAYHLPFSSDPDELRVIKREFVEEIVYALLKHLRERPLRTNE